MRTKLTGFLLMTAVFQFLAPAAEQSAKADKKETPEEQRIREYILRNPEVVVQALQLFQLKLKLAQRQQAQDAITTQQAALFHDPNSPAAGAGEGGVTIVEFFDYRCGYCKRVSGTVTKLLASDPRVRIVYKEFPILGPESELAAKAALAAHKQGAYVKLHHALMDMNDQITADAILELAGGLGLDTVKLKSDMDSDEVRAELEANQKLAAAVGVRSTPAFVAGSEVVLGALDEAGLQALIAKAAVKSSLSPPPAGDASK